MIGAYFCPDAVRGTFMHLMFQATVTKLPFALSLNQPANDSSGASFLSTRQSINHYLLTTITL